MKPFYAAIILILFFAFPQSLHAQLFNVISDADANLTSDEQSKLDTLRSNPAYDSIWMIEIDNVFSLQDSGEVYFSVPGYDNLRAIVNTINNDSLIATPDEYFWSGRIVDTIAYVDSIEYIYDGFLSLYKKNGLYMGLVSVPGDAEVYYEITSFPSGKPLLIRYTGNNGNTVCEQDGDGPEEEMTTGSCNTVRVLIVYTDKGAKAVANIQLEAQNAINLLNGAVWNTLKTTADLQFELAGIVSSGTYHETAVDIATEVPIFASNSYVQTLRNIYYADLVVGFVDFGGGVIKGVVAQIGPQFNTSYALVESATANERFNFCHEVGHLMGGRHQQDFVTNNNVDNTPGYAHGYKIIKNVTKKYGDIMHTYHQNVKAEHYFSSPNLKLHGKDFGDANDNDVMRTMLESTCTVAQFIHDFPMRFDVKLTGPSAALPNQNVTVTASPVYGVANYTYVWSVSFNGGSSYMSLGTTNSSGNSSKSFNMPSLPIAAIVCVVATSAGGEKVIRYKTVYGLINNSTIPTPKFSPSENSAHGVEEWMNTGSDKGELTIFPNPASNEISIVGVRNTDNGGVYLKIVDIYGRKVDQITVTPVSGKLNYNTSYLQSGTYFLHIGNDSKNEALRLVILK